MILVLGDLHIRKEEPFFSTVEKVLKEVETKLSSGDTFIQLGDAFHISRPYPKEIELFSRFLHRLKNKGVSVFLMSGNHDYLYTQESFSIEIFSSSEIVLVTTPDTYTIEGNDFLFLPWMPEEKVRSETDYGSLKEYYEAYAGMLPEQNLDYLLHHVEDETVFMGGENHGIDLSVYEDKFTDIERVGGHIHLQDKNYLGTPYQTRYDEKGQVGRYLVIEGSQSSYKELPTFHEYKDVLYSSELPKTEGSLILTIKEAPSVQVARDKFKDYYIRDVELQIENKREVNGEESERDFSDVSIKEHLQDFVTENKVNKKVAEHLFSLFS